MATPALEAPEEAGFTDAIGDISDGPIPHGTVYIPKPPHIKPREGKRRPSPMDLLSPNAKKRRTPEEMAEIMRMIKASQEASAGGRYVTLR